MKIKHSKYKNTGLIFELLVRKITAETLSGGKSQAIGILKSSFTNTELGKEYKLYETVFKNTTLSETKADILLNTILESSKKLSRSKLKREKYNLINEIKSHYDLDDFFKTKIANYKGYAALYTLIEAYSNEEKLLDTDEIINNKFTLLEIISNKTPDKAEVKDKLMEEFSKEDRDTKILTYRIMMDKFNGKYANLNESQKKVLQVYINSVDSTAKLKDFHNEKVVEIKEELTKRSRKVRDKATRIKVTEIVNLIKEIPKGTFIKNDDIVNLLQYYALIEEIDKANG